MYDYREQRVTGVFVFIMVGLSAFLAPVLKVNLTRLMLCFY